MFIRWLTGNLVVHDSGDIVLQRRLQLIDDCHVGSLLDLLFESVVDLKHLLVAVSEIVF